MFVLCLKININSITCPGVWLCPRGEIIIRINCFNVTKKTKRIYPKLPLYFDETLSFERVIVGGIDALLNLLENEEISIELVQWMYQSKFGVILAKFKRKLISFFEPFVINEGLSTLSKVDVLISKTNYFPGIISPKLRARFQMDIDTCKNYLTSTAWQNNKFLNCKCRQRAVCHSNFTPFWKPSNSNPFRKNSLDTLLRNNYDFEFPKLFFNDTRLSEEETDKYCSWCDNKNHMLCDCCCCWKYHVTFH